MTWLSDGPHRCSPPSQVRHGAVWRCECGRCWRGHEPGNPDYAGWRRIPGWWARLLVRRLERKKARL